jgi:transcriptional regulator with XRE-family HTH domain
MPAQSSGQKSALTLELKQEENRGGPMSRDWAAVAAAMKARLAELDMTQAELVQRSGLAPMTIREVLHNTAERRRSPQTLAALSEALGWPPGYLQAIAEGRDPGNPDAGDPVLAELARLKESITVINARLDAIEQQQAGGGGQS